MEHEKILQLLNDYVEGALHKAREGYEACLGVEEYRDALLSQVRLMEQIEEVSKTKSLLEKIPWGNGEEIDSFERKYRLINPKNVHLVQSVFNREVVRI